MLIDDSVNHMITGLTIAFGLFMGLLLFIGYWIRSGSSVMDQFEPYHDVEPFCKEDYEAFYDQEDIEFFDVHVIDKMKSTMSPNYSNSPYWVKAFNFYNRHNKPVSRLCSPCYFKVLQFIIQQKNEKSAK
jgi:hypothetical protein